MELEFGQFETYDWNRGRNRLVGISKKLIICCDLDMPGEKINNIDDWLSTLLHVHGYQQHVTEPTRGNNLLDLVITPTTSSSLLFILNVMIVSSQELFTQAF